LDAGDVGEIIWEGDRLECSQPLGFLLSGQSVEFVGARVRFGGDCESGVAVRADFDAVFQRDYSDRDAFSFVRVVPYFQSFDAEFARFE
jgi:hypothetical protein